MSFPAFFVGGKNGFAGNAEYFMGPRATKRPHGRVTAIHPAWIDPTPAKNPMGSIRLGPAPTVALAILLMIAFLKIAFVLQQREQPQRSECKNGDHNPDVVAA